MPIYTYRCSNCGVQFDRKQKFSDTPLTQCPECRKKTLHKVISPVGIVFKGSGFYATDNRSPSGMKHTSAHETKPAEDKGKESSTSVEKQADKSSEKPSDSVKEKTKE